MKFGTLTNLASVMIIGIACLAGCFDNADSNASNGIAIKEPVNKETTSAVAPSLVSDETNELALEENSPTVTSSTNKSDMTLLDENGNLNVNDIELPTKAADNSAINRKAIGGSAVTLKHAKYVPSFEDYNENRSKKVSCADGNSSYFCSDAYLISVQNSKNKIKVSNGEFVLTPNTSSELLDYDIAFVKDDVVIPSDWHLNNVDVGQSKFGKVNDNACFYGEFSLRLSTEYSLYNCIRFASDDYKDTISSIPIVLAIDSYKNEVSPEQFKKIVAGELESNYNTFSGIQ